MPLNADSFANLDTVSQQLTSSFNGASSSVASGIGGLQSSASSVMGAVGNIGAKLGAAGQSVLSAGKQSLDQLGSFTTVSKFKDSFKLPNAVNSIKPELTSGKSTNSVKTLTYPKDLGKYFITFSFYQTFKKSPLEQKIDKPTVVVSLPMPSDLVDKFNASYSAKDLGFFGKVVLDAYQTAVGAGMTDDAAKLAKATATNATKKLMSPTGLYAGARTTFNDSSIAAAADRATGMTLNPYTALQFQGVGLRKHSFKFKFSPNSKDESQALKDIILALKQRMLPERDGLLFLFPDSCVIKFNTPNMPYSFKTCFLEGLTVNYAPNGVPSFFKGGTDATDVELSLEFGETEPVTREDMMKSGGDITGGSKPYNPGEKTQYTNIPANTDAVVKSKGKSKEYSGESFKNGTNVGNPMGDIAMGGD